MCVTSDHCKWKKQQKETQLDCLMLVLELAVCGGVCFNGCVAMCDGERITSHSYCHERPGYNDSLRPGLSWVRNRVGKEVLCFKRANCSAVMGWDLGL